MWKSYGHFRITCTSHACSICVWSLNWASNRTLLTARVSLRDNLRHHPLLQKVTCMLLPLTLRILYNIICVDVDPQICFISTLCCCSYFWYLFVLMMNIWHLFHSESCILRQTCDFGASAMAALDHLSYWKAEKLTCKGTVVKLFRFTVFCLRFKLSRSCVWVPNF